MSAVGTQTLAGLTLAGVLVSGACGGGDDGSDGRSGDTGDASPTADTPAGYVAQMVIQAEDVPVGFQRTDEDGRVDLGGEAGIQANLSAFLMTVDESAAQVPSRFAEFEFPVGEAVSGVTICIQSFAAAFESREDAELALFNSVELTSEAFSGTPEVEVEQVEDDLGFFASVPYRLRSPREDLCSAYKDQPAEGYVIYFINHTVYGALFVWTAENGAELRGAATLGQKQFDRISAARPLVSPND